MHRRATTIRCPRRQAGGAPCGTLVAISATREGPAERFSCPICHRIWSVRDAQILARAGQFEQAQAPTGRPSVAAPDSRQMRLPEA